MWTYLPLLAFLSTSWGHGRLLVPPSRASAWRAGFPTAPNYDDDGVNCGGFGIQWSVNGGKCGICGDAYNLPPPRPHELGGAFGQGVIVARYSPGAYMDVTVELAASHKGFWEFKLCPDPEDDEQDCFDRNLLQLENGKTKYYPTKGSTKYNLKYKLPEGLVCEHCVVQWRYTAGNNWGTCPNGTQGLGCGNQEQFGACSDISIGLTREYRRKEKDYVSTNNNEIPYPLFNYLNYDAQKGFVNLLKNRKIKPQNEIKTTRVINEANESSRPKTKKNDLKSNNIKAKRKFKSKRRKNKRKNKKKYLKRNKKMPFWW